MDENVSVKKSRLFYGALAVAVLNPIFSGIILGVVMLREPQLKHEGKIVLVFSLAWGILALLIAAKYGILGNAGEAFKLPWPR